MVLDSNFSNEQSVEKALAVSQGELVGTVWMKGGAVGGRRFGAVQRNTETCLEERIKQGFLAHIINHLVEAYFTVGATTDCSARPKKCRPASIKE